MPFFWNNEGLNPNAVTGSSRRDIALTSVLSDGTTMIGVHCPSPHGLTRLDIIAIYGLSDNNATGFYYVSEVISDTFFTYETLYTISGGSLQTENTILFAADIGVPYGYDKVPYIATPSIVCPVNTVLPVISGDPVIGSIFSCTNGTWTGTQPIAYTYQWYRNGIAIEGATSNTWVADSIGVITVTVTATNIGCAGSATSLSSYVGRGANALVVYDLNSVSPNRYNSDVHPSTIAANISIYESQLDITTSVITSYAEFESYTDSQIAEFAYIWDVGYDTLITSGAADKYETFLSGGGALFLLGENGGFYLRDESIDNFINLVGGGPVVPSYSDPGAMVTCTINPQFLIENQFPLVIFNRPGKFTSYGNGTVMADNYPFGTVAVVWQMGKLTYPNAAIASVLDVNFLAGSLAPDFIKNLILVLDTQ